MSCNEENEGALNRYVGLAAGNFWQEQGSCSVDQPWFPVPDEVGQPAAPHQPP